MGHKHRGKIRERGERERGRLGGERNSKEKSRDIKCDKLTVREIVRVEEATVV